MIEARIDKAYFDVIPVSQQLFVMNILLLYQSRVFVVVDVDNIIN